MLGRSCSLKPSAQPFLNPSVLSAPPPVTSSSSYYPVVENNHVTHIVAKHIQREDLVNLSLREAKVTVSLALLM